MDNSMILFIFFLYDQKYTFWEKLVQKSKLSVEGETWYLYFVEYAEFIGDVHIFSSGWKYSFWGNLVQSMKIVSLS